MGILILFLILRVKLSAFSLLSIMLTMCLSFMAFIKLRYIPPTPTFLRVFITWNKCLNLIKFNFSTFFFCCYNYSNVPTFISNISNLNFFIFLLISLAKKLVNFVTFSKKKQLLVSFTISIFSYYLFQLHTLIFIIHFILLLGLACSSFLVSYGIKLGY